MIFVDSSAWVALGLRSDDRHPVAAALLASTGDRPLVTSNHVRGETWTFLRRRAGHRAAVDFLDRIERSPRVRTEHLSQAIEEEALAWLRVRGEREYSFVDATSFAFMSSEGIAEALAFDGDFSAAGFVELRT